MSKASQLERFWRFVQKTSECWNWTGCTAGRYGQFTVAHKQRMPAHRFSYEIHFDEIPSNMLVCHHCDNSLCVNPEHLFLGTQKDNMIDMASKDRNPWNKNPGKRKLTERDVLKIRQSNKNNKELAKLFQVTATNIWHIKNRKTWKHIA